MFKLIALLSLFAVAALGQKGGPRPPPFPFAPTITTCLACQKLVEDVTGAVQTAKVAYYDALTDDQCNNLFGSQPIVQTFCLNLVAAGKAAVQKLVRENVWDAEDTCISLGACEAKACPDGHASTAAFLGVWQQVGQTDLCVSCSNTNVDRFTAEFAKFNNQDQEFPNVHICSIDEYRSLADFVPLAGASAYFTQNGSPCTPTSGCSGAEPHLDIDILSPEHDGTGPNLYLDLNLGQTYTVQVPGGSDARSVSASPTNVGQVCLCARYGDNVPHFY